MRAKIITGCTCIMLIIAIDVYVTSSTFRAAVRNVEHELYIQSNQIEELGELIDFLIHRINKLEQNTKKNISEYNIK